MIFFKKLCLIKIIEKVVCSNSVDENKVEVVNNVVNDNNVFFLMEIILKKIDKVNDYNVSF